MKINYRGPNDNIDQFLIQNRAFGIQLFIEQLSLLSFGLLLVSVLSIPQIIRLSWLKQDSNDKSFTLSIGNASLFDMSKILKALKSENLQETIMQAPIYQHLQVESVISACFMMVVLHMMFKLRGSY